MPHKIYKPFARRVARDFGNFIFFFGIVLCLGAVLRHVVEEASLPVNSL